MTTRLAVKASIRRAMMAGRKGLETLDADSRAELERLYRSAVADITDRLSDYADDAGNLRAEALSHTLQQVRTRLSDLAGERDATLNTSLYRAAQLGVQPFAQDGAGVSVGLGDLAEDATRFVQRFVAEDGLQLSDRLWRIDRHARQAVEEHLESAVLQGHSASRAAREFLARGEEVPADVLRKINAASAGRIARNIRADVLRDDDSAYSNALRVFRTEINRAHGEAFRAGMDASPEVIGERFVLSPAHPRPDECDLHASANLHGLGPGVYPVGKSPWPAHPNTLSYLEPVFRDETTEADKAGKTSRLEWLAAQSPEDQDAILGKHKAEAFRRGLLRENQIKTPWRVLKKRFEGEPLSPRPPATPPAPPAPPPPAPAARTFAYESYAPVKSISEAEVFLRNADIAEKASLKGLGLPGLQAPLQAMQEVTERFNLRPLAAIGPISRFGRFRTPRNANAAIFPGAIRGGTGRHGVFHTPTKFGSLSGSQKNHELALKTASRYKEEARTILNSYLGAPGMLQTDPEVLKRFARLKVDEYGWSVSSMTRPELAAKVTTYHEYGHVLHLVNATIGDDINRFLSTKRPRQGGWQALLSKYGGSNDAEFVAESFAIYMSRPEEEHYRIHPGLLAIFKKWDQKP